MLAQRCHQRASPCPYRTVSGPQAQSWRHRRALQSRQPQDGAARKAICAVGVQIIFLLLPDSLDFNSTEQVFAKLETQLWRIAERSIAATCKRIGSLLKCFSAQECANWLRNSGYASTSSHSALNYPVRPQSHISSR